MTIYLCTCGTSAAKNLPRESHFDAAWVEAHGGIESATTVVHASFQTYSMDDEAALKRYLSAEIHSLARMGLNASDTVVLFSSETPDGQVCARALKRYLERALPGLSCRIEVIPGLQVTDARRFRTEGVLKFTQAVLRIIDASDPSYCVLNPTGGFKSLVPYTVLIGMIKGVPAQYIFEQSSALIPLPVMPVEFARTRIEPIRPLLERIQQESAILKTNLDAALPFAERTALDPLFEDQGNGQVSLSPVGFLIWEELERPSALVPFLSRRALEDLLEVRRVQDCKPDDYIPRVARDRAQLETAKHISWGHGLFWLKPGDTRDRYLVSVEGWRLLVWRIVLHQGEYEVLLAQNQPPDAGAGILATRRKHYEPFVRMELYEAC